jgi:hypothetical protein
MHFFRFITCSLVLLSASSVSRQAVAQDPGVELTAPTRVPGRELPSPSTPEIVGNWMLVGGGALLLAGWGTNALGGLGAGVDCSIGFYGGSLGGTGGGGCNHDARWEDFRTWSLVPVVGPHVQLALLPEEGRGGGWPGWLIASAIIQTSGLALLIAGLVTKLRAPNPAKPKDPPAFLVTPIVSADGAGLSVSSAF